MYVHGVQEDELGTIFPLALPFLMNIPRLGDRYAAEDILAEIQQNNWQLWIMFDKKIEGSLITTVVQYPKRRELHMLGIAGTRMKEWIGLIKTIEQYATQNDCDSIVMLGVRRGFGKLLPDYRGNRLVLEKEI